MIPLISKSKYIYIHIDRYTFLNTAKTIIGFRSLRCSVESTAFMCYNYIPQSQEYVLTVMSHKEKCQNCNKDGPNYYSLICMATDSC